MNYKSRTIPTKEPVIISVHEFQGVDRLDIRHYYLSSSVEKGLMPTTKGISVPMKDAPAVIAAILQVIEIDAKQGTVSDITLKTATYMPVRAAVQEYKGYKRVDIRHYWQPKGKSKLAPSDKGVAVPIEFAQTLVEILNDLQKALQADVAEPEISIPVTASKRFAMVEA